MIAWLAFGAALASSDPLPDDVELPLKIATSVRIDELSSIDEATGTFDATADVILEWTDPAQAFDQLQEGSERRIFSGTDADAELERIWDPGVEIANLTGEPEAREVNLTVHSNGHVEYVQRLRATFDVEIDLGDFPFDTQRPGLRLITPGYSSRQVALTHLQLQAERSGVAPGAVALPEWQERGLSFAAAEFRGLDGTLHSSMNAELRMTRLASAYIASLFAPLIVILLLPCLCIWVKTDIHERINWVVTAVFSLIALNFSVTIEYPALGIDSRFMSLFWYGYVAQGVALALIMLLFNEGRLAARFGQDLIDEMHDYLTWALPAIIALAFGDVLLSLAF